MRKASSKALFPNWYFLHQLTFKWL
jgi:hypothetical protein